MEKSIEQLIDQELGEGSATTESKLFNAKGRDNSFNYFDGRLNYQIPYILPGEKEDANVMDTMEMSKAESTQFYALVKGYNDKMNDIFDKAQKDIQKIGRTAAKELEKKFPIK